MKAVEPRRSLADFPGGVYILCVRADDEVNGMVASWVTPVSGDPPLIAVAIRPDRYSHDMIEKAGAFSLSLLKKNQADTVPRFKRKGADKTVKFDGIETEESTVVDAPLIKGVRAHVECELMSKASPGDHTVFYARIVRAASADDETSMPLTTVDYGKGYIG